jgi:hypothetical protein
MTKYATHFLTNQHLAKAGSWGSHNYILVFCDHLPFFGNNINNTTPKRGVSLQAWSPTLAPLSGVAICRRSALLSRRAFYEFPAHASLFSARLSLTR